MNKAELIEKVAEKRNVTKKEANVCIDTVFEVIAKALANGDEVKISGFGNFKVKKIAARTAKNPMTKEIVKVPASKKVAFKQATALKEML